MENVLNQIKFDIKEVGKLNDGRTYKVNIIVPMSLGWLENVCITFESNGIQQVFKLKHLKNEGNYAYFEDTINLKTSAIYHYYFSLEANNQFMFYKKDNVHNTQTISNEEKWRMSVGFEVPDWAKGKIMYHIFVDRFYRGSKDKPADMPNRTIHSSWKEEPIIGPDHNGIWNADFYGGDLLGIIDKLDYIQSLGVSILYLSPVVYSQSNHGYDTSDYENVDPYKGSNDDLKKLCDEAHKRGMKVVLDVVFNHTGNDSKYFNEYGHFKDLGAFQSKDSPYYPYYRKYYDNNGNVYFDYWWGMKNLPVCDGYNPEWQQYIYGEGGVIDKWFSCGIDGLHLDVADELSDEFIEGIRRAVKRNKEDGLIIGEVWKNPMRMNRGYLSSGKGMDSVMNYPLVDALIKYFKYGDYYGIREILREINTEYPKETMLALMNFTSTHDISRIIDILGSFEFSRTREWSWDLNNDDRAYTKNFILTPEQYTYGKTVYEAYIFALAFLPGILSIFYGDEVGVQGLGNLSNRQPFPWHNMDLDLLEYFRYIGRIRNSEKFLEQADLNILDINEQYMMFERVLNGDRGLAIVNRTGDFIEPGIPVIYQKPSKIYTLKKSNQKILTPYGGIYLKN